MPTWYPLEQQLRASLETSDGENTDPLMTAYSYFIKPLATGCEQPLSFSAIVVSGTMVVGAQLKSERIHSPSVGAVKSIPKADPRPL